MNSIGHLRDYLKTELCIKLQRLFKVELQSSTTAILYVQALLKTRLKISYTRYIINNYFFCIV